MTIFCIYKCYAFNCSPLRLIAVKESKPKQAAKRQKAGKKDTQLLIRINSAERDSFISLCEELDTSAAREIRRFIRSFLKEHDKE